MLHVFIYLCAILHLVYSDQLTASIPAKWNQEYQNKTKPNSFLNYKLTARKGNAGRVYISREDVHLDIPLLVVVRQKSELFSFSLPANIDQFLFTKTARTIRPFTEDQDISIEFSSFKPISFKFEAKLIEDSFELPLNKSVTITTTVAQPVFYLVTVPSDTDSLSLNVDSNSTSCMIVSVQPATGPVSDLTSNVFSSGMYQSMTKSATITVMRADYPKFYLVFVMKPTDDECTKMIQLKPAPDPSWASEPLQKVFNVTLINKFNETQYLAPVAIMLLILLVIFIISTYYMQFETSYSETDSVRYIEVRDDMAVVESHYVRDPEDDESTTRSYDCLPDVGDREVIRAKPNLMVADLAVRTYKERNDKYKKYVYNLCILSLFYMLPTVQLVLNALDNVHSYGNLDLCWYNFRCAKPLWKFFAINNIISNSAYVFLGVLLIFMTYERNSQYWKDVAKEPALETDLGLPQHPSLMYAIGIAIVMEGLLSASYHVCPNATNYQFDTSFMYVIALLGMLKIYQLRHPDIIANAHVAYGVMGGFIFIAMIGVRWEGPIVWFIFPFVYVAIMLIVSIEFYYKGVWKISIPELKNNCIYAWASSKHCSFIVPRYKKRFFFLVLANAINIGFIIYGESTRPTDFASYLLNPFLANLFLYFVYYIVMKIAHRERHNLQTVLFLAIATLCWGISMWFFFHMVSDWSETPAKSKELNRDCIVLNFFDNHDVWHFLSAIAMFISFILLDRIDDDLRFTTRSKIPVF